MPSPVLERLRNSTPTLDIKLAGNRTWSESNISYVPDTSALDDLISEFKKSLFVYDEPTSVVLIVLYIPIFIVAFVGNLTILIVVLPNRKLRSVTNFFLVNLAGADLLVTYACMPLAVGLSVYRVWIYGQFMCKLTHYLQGVAVSASVITLTIMALERYLAIRHPMTFRRVSTSSHARALVAFVWLFAFTIIIPIALVREVTETPPIENFDPMPFCIETWTSLHKSVYMICLVVFVYIIPGVVIGLSYSFIGCQLLITDKGIHRQDSRAVQDQTKAIIHGRRKVARMLMCLAILFAVCWLPYNIVSLYIDLQYPKPVSGGWLVALPFTLCLGHSNSALNPCCYWFMNNSFRKAVKKKFGCWYLFASGSSRLPKTPSPLNNVQVHYSRANGSLRTSLVNRDSPHVRAYSYTSSPSKDTSFRSTSLRLSKTRENGTDKVRDHRRLGDNNPGKGLRIEIHLAPDETPNTKRETPKQRQEILNHRLSIPSTINEESRIFTREGSRSPSFNVLNEISERIDDSPPTSINGGEAKPTTMAAVTSCLDVVTRSGYGVVGSRNSAVTLTLPLPVQEDFVA